MDSGAEYFVRSMVGGEIPLPLLRRLERVDKLVQMCAGGGQLLSRQVLAVVVEQWEREVAAGLVPSKKARKKKV